MVIEGVVGRFEPEKNFWELYPIFKTLSPTKKFYNRDRSENHSRSSREMWGFCFLYDMSIFNPLRNMDEDLRMEIIAQDIIENPKYDWEKESEVMEFMRDCCQPAPQKSLYDWGKKMRERDSFIRDTPYTLDYYSDKGKLVKGTADQLDRMMKGTNDIYEQYESWQKKVIMERDGRANKNISESDSDEI